MRSMNIDPLRHRRRISSNPVPAAGTSSSIRPSQRKAHDDCCCQEWINEANIRPTCCDVFWYPQAGEVLLVADEEGHISLRRIASRKLLWTSRCRCCKSTAGRSTGGGAAGHGGSEPTDERRSPVTTCKAQPAQQSAQQSAPSPPSPQLRQSALSPLSAEAPPAAQLPPAAQAPFVNPVEEVVPAPPGPGVGRGSADRLPPTVDPWTARYLHDLVGATTPPPPLPSALVSAYALHRSQWVPKTWRKIQKASQEFHEWLLERRLPTTLLTCEPSLVVEYLEGAWVSRHPGRLRADRRPSASALDAITSHLSTAFRLLSRDGPYDPVSGRGNPCDSTIVRGYTKGNRRSAGRAGHCERSAVPLEIGKFHALCLYLCREAAVEVEPFLRSLFLRDLAVFTLMWHTYQRGHDIGKLMLSDFREVAHGHSEYSGWPLPPLDPDLRVPSGTLLRIEELGTKTHQGRRAPAIMVRPSEEPSACPLGALSLYMDLCRTLGMPVEGYLFRPVIRGGRRYREAPLSTEALEHRLVMHLEAAGLYGGETIHSFRRGSLQHALQMGVSEADLMRLSHIRSIATLRRYVDPTRHQARLAPRHGGSSSASS
ncbi:hypothetical protein Vretimale_18025, partial [Volvox reticuliferus]